MKTVTNFTPLTAGEIEVVYALVSFHGAICQDKRNVLLGERPVYDSTGKQAGTKYLVALYRHTSAAHIVTEEYGWLDRKPYSLGGVWDEPNHTGSQG